MQVDSVIKNMCSDKEVIIEIPQGRLYGIELKSAIGDVYFGFLGIPYGKPPIGPLRFKAPEPAEGWEGVRDATASGAVAASTDLFHLDVCFGNEDCLFANVFVNKLPGESDKKQPVLVWIHGGGFGSGTGNRELYSPEIFMHHDVVVVSFNYRLGPFGFLSLQSASCPGNFGLKDQRLLLQWVQNNISHFGGDPSNVTIFGESAGGASVTYHMLSRSCEGLFKRGIAQSSSATNYYAYAEYPREMAFLLGKRLGCDTDDDNVLMDFLKEVPTEEIVLKSQTVQRELLGEAPGEHIFSLFPYVPTAEPDSEEAFITEHPSVLLEKGQFQDVPYLAGLCSREMIGMGLRRAEDFPKWKTDEEFEEVIPRALKLVKGSEESLTVARKLREFYYKNGPNLKGYLDVLSDSFFNYEVFRTVRRLSSDSIRISPVWLYLFTYEGKRNTFKVLFQFNFPGTAHTDDLGYLFKTAMAPLPDIEPGTPDADFMLKFTKLWVDFATNGEPSQEIAWPPTNNSDFPYLDIGNEITVKTNFLKDRMDLWDEIYQIAKK